MHENLEDHLEARTQFLQAIESITDSTSFTESPKLEITSYGVFVDNIPLAEADSEQRIKLEQEPFTLYLPAAWKVRNMQNRKHPFFLQTAKFIVGSCDNNVDFSLDLWESFTTPLEQEEKLSELKQFETFEEVRAHDGKHIIYIEKERDAKKVLEGYIPGVREVYRLTCEGEPLQVEQIKPDFQTALKNFYGIWTGS
jgi:hypothetical protein